MEHYRSFLQRVTGRPQATGPIHFGIGYLIEQIGTGFEELAAGIQRMEQTLMTSANVTQDSLAAEAAAVTALTASWQGWASNVQQILTNVEDAWKAAQTANPALSSADLDAAISAGQQAFAALPTETDPTQPAPAPAPAPEPAPAPAPEPTPGS